MTGAFLKCVTVRHAIYCELTTDGQVVYIILLVMALIAAIAALTAATK